MMDDYSFYASLRDHTSNNHYSQSNNNREKILNSQVSKKILESKSETSEVNRITITNVNKNLKPDVDQVTMTEYV